MRLKLDVMPEDVPTLLKIMEAYTYAFNIVAKCGHVHMGDRHGPALHCLKCGLELHADIAASRNIAQRGISVLSRPSADRPSVATGDLGDHDPGRGRLQAPSLEVR